MPRLRQLDALLAMEAPWDRRQYLPIIAVLLGISGSAGVSSAAEALRTPDEIGSSIVGCWDRLPWPGQIAMRAEGGVWEETVCFFRDGKASIDVLGSSGTVVLVDGSTAPDMERWGDEGRYSLSADRVIINGAVWNEADQLSCHARSVSANEIVFFDCIARTAGSLGLGEGAEFRRSTDTPNG